MTTFVYDLVSSIENNWEEVDILIDLAESQPNNDKLFNALCRSAIVLMVAHFEGFLKSSVKAIVQDANKFSRFKDLPDPLKRTFCHSLTKESDEKKTQDLNNRLVRLIEIFDGLDTKIDAQCFLVQNNFGNDQKNPTSPLIEKICMNFGVKKFFSQIQGSKLDVFFEDDKSESDNIKKQLEEHVETGVREYPYNLNKQSLGIKAAEEAGRSARTSWEGFLDNVLMHRHNIAHGTSTDNSFSVSEIRTFKNQLQVMQYSLVLVLCENCKPNPLPNIE